MNRYFANKETIPRILKSIECSDVMNAMFEFKVTSIAVGWELSKYNVNTDKIGALDLTERRVLSQYKLYDFRHGNKPFNEDIFCYAFKTTWDYHDSFYSEVFYRPDKDAIKFINRAIRECIKVQDYKIRFIHRISTAKYDIGLRAVKINTKGRRVVYWAKEYQCKLKNLMGTMAGFMKFDIEKELEMDKFYIEQSVPFETRNRVFSGVFPDIKFVYNSSGDKGRKLIDYAYKKAQKIIRNASVSGDIVLSYISENNYLRLNEDN